eukprot:TRINITY_DN5475_c0_g5_i1.p1 TRINITY_DN5475_c0_g5~~TRINITY_DN5475_c0_g5_i1.p1  ORF type:complete len:554 (-),score=122.98 TRINITY_DN5475_c0_g5_i1:21-1682(-)
MAEFKPGAKVRIKDLESRPEFNGKEAEIGSFNENAGDYECWLLADEHEGQYVYCKADNMELVPEEEKKEEEKKEEDKIAKKDGEESGSSRSRSRSKSKKKSKKSKKKKKKKKKGSSSSSSSSSSSGSSRTHSGRVEELRVFEFFSGIGGLRAAFHKASLLAGQPIAYRKHIIDDAGISEVGDGLSSGVREWVPLESSQMANDVYRKNFSLPYAPLLPHDVRRLDERDLEGADLWLLSPPCQPYTKTGRQRDADDGRAAPLAHLTELLPKLRHPPKALFLENVVGFETSESWRSLASALCQAGFEVRIFSLSPQQLGIPNRRPRVYVVARQSEEPCVHELETSFPGTVAASQPVPRNLEGYLDNPNEVDMKACAVSSELLQQLSERGQRWEVVRPASTSSSTFTSGYGTACFESHRFGPLLCIDESMATSADAVMADSEATQDRSNAVVWPEEGRELRVVLPSDADSVRLFTATELLRIAGFPDHFKFSENFTAKQCYKLLGDSINVDVVAHLLHYLLFEWTQLGSTANPATATDERRNCDGVGRATSNEDFQH